MLTILRCVHVSVCATSMSGVVLIKLFCKHIIATNLHRRFLLHPVHACKLESISQTERISHTTPATAQSKSLSASASSASSTFHHRINKSFPELFLHASSASYDVSATNTKQTVAQMLQIRQNLPGRSGVTVALLFVLGQLTERIHSTLLPYLFPLSLPVEPHACT